VSSGNFLLTFQDNLSDPTPGVKNPKESLLSQYGVYIGKSVWVKSLSSAVSANRVNANGWEGGEHGNQCSFEEGHSVIEEIIMDVTARHRRTLTSAKWEEGKGKKVQYLVNKQIIQSTTTGGGKSEPSAAPR